MVNYKNAYKSPEGLEVKVWHLDTPPEEYDLNFIFPLPSTPLSSPSGVVLLPLIPSLHAQALYKRVAAYPEIYKYLPYGPFKSFNEFLTFLEMRRREEGTLLFVIYDMSLDFEAGSNPLSSSSKEEEHRQEVEIGVRKGYLREERIAGLSALLKSSRENQMTELGHIQILPPFHRTHITTHSQCLLLQYCLSPSTLSLRRVQWFANSNNHPSVNAALKLGFKKEGVLRWDRVLPVGKESVAEGPKPDDGVQQGSEVWKRLEGGGRHSAVLSVGWDEWVKGDAKEHLDNLLSREVLAKKAPLVLTVNTN